MKPTMRWMQIVLLSLLCACGGGSDSTENNRSHQTINLSSGIMRDNYPLTVILPADYANQVMPLPVILVLDGRWHQQRVADEVAATGTAAIVVGIGNDQRREPDFVPPDFHGSFGLSDGLADDYVDMLRNEILPTLEQRYNINPEQRYIVGHSLGGLLVEYALLTDNPDNPTFRGYFISDASNFSADYLRQLEANFYQHTTRLPVALYCASATTGNNQIAQLVARQMEQHSYPELRMTIHSYETGHDGVMAPAVRDGMRFFFPPGL
jgi:predicted alpha/beta superfamily hydrolase